MSTHPCICDAVGRGDKFSPRAWRIYSPVSNIGDIWSLEEGADESSIVLRVHAGMGAVNKLIVTDGYIFLTQSEHATTGGFGNFLRYLDVLELRESSTLTILVPPDVRGGGREAQIIWTRAVSEYAKRRQVSITVQSFRAGCHFHDRFYLAQHSGGKISGLFGPSMNGLGDKDFVLIGEMESNVIARLKTYLEL